jgi:hypothetical protein
VLLVLSEYDFPHVAVCLPNPKHPFYFLHEICGPHIIKRDVRDYIKSTNVPFTKNCPIKHSTSIVGSHSVTVSAHNELIAQCRSSCKHAAPGRIFRKYSFFNIFILCLEEPNAVCKAICALSVLFTIAGQSGLFMCFSFQCSLLVEPLSGLSGNN